MKLPAPERVLTIACGSALVALALIVWPLLDPRPIPVIVAMSVGQVIGTISFVAFLLVVVTDVRSRYRVITPEAAPPQETKQT